MKPEELARKNCDTTINLKSCCDMSHCMGRVQIVLIVEQEEWQLCTACYEKYLTAIDNPRTRDAAEQRVQRTACTRCPACGGMDGYHLDGVDCGEYRRC